MGGEPVSVTGLGSWKRRLGSALLLLCSRDSCPGETEMAKRVPQLLPVGEQGLGSRPRAITEVLQMAERVHFIAKW